MSTQQNSLVTVTVGDGAGGVRNLSVFDTRTGGVTSGEPGKTRPGGMVGEKVWGGLSSTDDVTVTRVYERERDVALAAQLRRLAGHAPGSVTEQPLDDTGTAFGKPTTWSGKLKSVDTGEYNSGSVEARMLTLVFVIAEVS